MGFRNIAIRGSSIVVVRRRLRGCGGPAAAREAARRRSMRAAPPLARADHRPTILYVYRYPRIFELDSRPLISASKTNEKKSYHIRQRSGGRGRPVVIPSQLTIQFDPLGISNFTQYSNTL